MNEEAALSTVATDEKARSLTVEEMRERIDAYRGGTSGETAGVAFRRFLRAAIWGYPDDDDSPVEYGEGLALERVIGLGSSMIYRLPRLNYARTCQYAIPLGLAVERLVSGKERFVIKPGSMLRGIPTPAALPEVPVPDDAFDSWDRGRAYGFGPPSYPGDALHDALCTGAGFNPQAFGAKARCAQFLRVSLRRYSQIVHRNRIRPVAAICDDLQLAIQGAPRGWVIAVDP